MTTSTHDMTEIDREAVARDALAAVARRMRLTEAQVAQSFALTSWTTVDELILRKFEGAYRGYFPKCRMELRAEAVIAELFDQIAIALGDPRRAMRCGAWTPPGGWTGGRCDG